jgi:hypothetical protein
MEAGNEAKEVDPGGTRQRTWGVSPDVADAVFGDETDLAPFA